MRMKGDNKNRQNAITFLLIPDTEIWVLSFPRPQNTITVGWYMVTFLFYFSSLPITSPVAPSPLRNPLECICYLSFDVYASLQTKNHVSLNLYNGIVL